MGKKKEEKKQEKVSKKAFRNEVIEKLSAALAVYKQELGEKKFRNRVRKASKLFSEKLGKSVKKVDEKNNTVTRRKDAIVIPEPIPA